MSVSSSMLFIAHLTSFRVSSSMPSSRSTVRACAGSVFSGPAIYGNTCNRLRRQRLQRACAASAAREGVRRLCPTRRTRSAVHRVGGARCGQCTKCGPATGPHGRRPSCCTPVTTHGARTQRCTEGKVHGVAVHTVRACRGLEAQPAAGDHLHLPNMGRGIYGGRCMHAWSGVMASPHTMSEL